VTILTVRNLPDDVHRSLRMRAARHGRSTAAEVRAILIDAAKPDGDLRMGDALAALGRKVGLTREDIAFMDELRHNTPAEPFPLG